MSVGSGAESQNTSLFLHDGSPVSPLSQQIQRLYGIIPEAKVHHLQKRYDVDDYNRLVQRGQDLFCLMSADINTADQLMDKPSQSTWTDYGDLEKYGYTVEEQQNSFRNLQKYAAVGEALSFGIDYVRNQDISIEHSEEWIGDNGEENRVGPPLRDTYPIWMLINLSSPLMPSAATSTIPKTASSSPRISCLRRTS